MSIHPMLSVVVHSFRETKIYVQLFDFLAKFLNPIKFAVFDLPMIDFNFYKGYLSSEFHRLST